MVLHLPTGKRGRVFAMILTDVKIWNEVKEEFEVFEALVDTGSTYCVIDYLSG